MTYIKSPRSWRGMPRGGLREAKKISRDDDCASLATSAGFNSLLVPFLQHVVVRLTPRHRYSSDAALHEGI